ncbi:hypothetical protein QBC39DRAFT_326383 [Podospora conica]|nr:hypothetical protein QBC39DRAFT_326383 [Schizothecium conicum]
MADWDADDDPDWDLKWQSPDDGDDSFEIRFVHGPLDSFNGPFGPSLSAKSSRSLHRAEVAPIRHADFISLVTAISHAYRRDIYLEMRKLDGVLWDDIDAGSVFQVSRSQIRFRVEEWVRSDSAETGTIVNKVVIKRVKKWSMSPTNVRAFSRELRILDHMRDVNNIVRLRGVGWFYNWDTTRHIPEPVLLLEEAQHTLQYLVGSRLPPVQLLGLFHDIASGLSALHGCNIVHGDIKPPNVLLFPVTRLHEGVEIPAYTAKLSDFSLAVLDNGSRQHLPGGTYPYMAPEAQELLDFTQLKLTDVYSLGMLFAVVAAGTEALLSLDATHVLDLDISDLPRRIMQRADADGQGSTLARSQVELFGHIFKTTLRTDPAERDLPGLLRSLDTHVGTRPEPTTTEVLYDPSPVEVEISYTKFASLSGHIRDDITMGLQRIYSSTEADLRYTQACFELGVIYTSKFGGPTASPLEGLQYLRASADKGDLRARAVYGRLLAVYGGEADADYRGRRLEWLYSAARKGYRIAQEELADANPQMAQEAQREYALASPQALKFTPSQQPVPGRPFWGSLTSIPTSSTSNHHSPTGDTPLLTACRYGQFESATALLSLAAVDASVSNRSGENPLHFLSNFNLPQTKALLLQLLPCGADFDQEAHVGHHGHDWDLCPRLVGTPIERAALHGRLDLVKLFLEHGCLIVPRNGNQLRRMLLMAFRLQHTDLQRFLINYASSDRDEPGFRNDLRPLHDTVWAYKGYRLSYIEAGVLGWVRHAGAFGLDVPLSFWQACYHGPRWRMAMQTTTQNALQLSCTYRSTLECLMDKAAVFAVREKAYDAFLYLLDKKIMHTDGDQGRLKSLQPLCWRETTSRDTNTAEKRLVTRYIFSERK